MIKLLKGITMSFSMFSIIPMPYWWEDNATRFIMPAFPLVGAVIGMIWFGLSLLFSWLNFPLMLSSGLLLIVPLFMSGFIHIDGLMDTSDAIGSNADLDKKRAILKDSHVGAFAVITLGCYLVIGFSAVYDIIANGKSTIAFIFIPILSRCLVATLLLKVRLMSKTGFGATFRQGTKPVNTIIVVALGVAAICLSYIFGGLAATLPLLALLLGGILGALYAIKKLDGISGDLCGFILTISELCGLITLAVI